LNQFHNRRYSISLLTLTILFMSLTIIGNHNNIAAQTEDGDLLAYTIYSYDEGTSLMLYDPLIDESILLYEYEGDGRLFRFSFIFSQDGRIALRLLNEYELLILNIRTPGQPPMNLSETLGLSGYPLSWSPDGRYLAFASHDDNRLIYVWDGDTAINIVPDSLYDAYLLSWSPDGRYLAFTSSDDEDNQLIYVWDGDTALNITPDDLDYPLRSYQAMWSYDGRLAFTVRYDGFPSPEGNHSEIYVWDGNITTNLSQNSTVVDHSHSWNIDGELAFFSARNGEIGIFVWDGVSVNNGSPDVDTFINIAPELPSSILPSALYWANDGRLAFEATGPEDNRHSQVYVWNRKTVTNYSQNPTLHNGAPRWSADGYLAFVTYFSSEQLLYVHDVDNRIILTTEGQYTPAWSSDGNLMFCKQGWTLYMWDRQEIVEIAHGDEIYAKWQSGRSVGCSSG
jgi:Tol biopolymer transport system component